MNAPKKTGTRSAFFRGSEGMKRTDEELEHAKQRAEQRKALGHQPFRFYVPVGETRRIIICDDEPDFFMYEHALKDADGKWGRVFSGCVKSFDNCPVCAVSERESYYAMVLTCIDLTPFQLRDGTDVEFSRKLLIVKPAQQKKFLRFFTKEGTLRGAMFDMTRDGNKDSAIGNDIDFVDFVDEDELQTYTRSWKDKDGKKQTEICDEPYDYEKLFEEPTAEKLRALVGGEPTPGSREAERSVGGRSARGRGTPERGAARKGRNDDDWEKADDSSEYEAEAPRRRGRAEPEEPEERASTARRSRREPEPEEDEAPPPRRGARRSAEPEEAAPRGRRTREAEPEPEEASPRRRRAAPEPDEAEEAPEPRTSRRTVREAPSRTTGTARRTARPAVDVEDDDIPY